MVSKLLVVGASGYVGARVERDLSGVFSVTGTCNSKQLNDKQVKLDIRDINATFELFDRVRPDVVVHAAALASSSECNNNPELARAINVDGTINLVRAANKVGARFIFISAATVKLNSTQYEKTKAEAEEIVRSEAPAFDIVQPLVVFGISPNIWTKKPSNQIFNNVNGEGAAKYDNSWRFQPTWINDISAVVRFLIEHNIDGETVPVAVSDGGLKTNFEIARDILSNFGIKPEPVSSSSRPDFPMDLGRMKKLSMPMHTYSQMIEGIVAELKAGKRKA